MHCLEMMVLLCTLQYCIEYSSTVSLFKPRVSGSKHKSSSDIAGTAKKHQVMKMETKVNIIKRVK